MWQSPPSRHTDPEGGEKVLRWWDGQQWSWACNLSTAPPTPRRSLKPRCEVRGGATWRSIAAGLVAFGLGAAGVRSARLHRFMPVTGRCGRRWISRSQREIWRSVSRRCPPRWSDYITSRHGRK
ncbi:DUF2510 domain-containing protein [Nocardiaceae bacterium NPDC056970]